MTFSCAMLFGASRTTLPKVLICVILSQEYFLGEQKKTFVVLSFRLLTTLYKKKILLNVLLILLGQHCIDKNPVQCCPRGSQYHIGISSCQCCLNTSEITLRIYLFNVGLRHIYSVYSYIFIYILSFTFKSKKLFDKRCTKYRKKFVLT